MPLVISTFCFLVAFAYTVFALRKGYYRPGRRSLVLIGTGFIFQTIFLHHRGEQIGHCPLTNLFEVLIFLCWSINLLYLVVGHTYRLSLLGAFTAPLVFVIQVVALITPFDTPAQIVTHPNPWAELHAALSVIAYGAFAMAGVAGVMYLVQERQLKTHHLHSLFFLMPPITTLAIANNRLLWAGFGILTAGLFAGIMVGAPVGWIKMGWGIGMWLVYLAIICARRLGPRRIALLSLGAFLLTFPILWGVHFFVEKARILAP
ncbi:MAG: cytochrome c biogenesis protein CcsA [Verrucomicrobiota bacterium]